jgi:hypothetical protein
VGPGLTNPAELVNRAGTNKGEFMKYLILVFSLALSVIATSASASQAEMDFNVAEFESEMHALNLFPVQAFAFASPYQVTVQVQNVYARPIACEGWVQATTQTGYPMQSYFTMAPMFAGMMGYAYVQAPIGMIFINAWANAYCRFVY